METRYGTNDNGDALVDAISYNHIGYRDITELEWKALVKGINNPPKTTLEKIRELESSITERNKQEAILGDEYAIAIIQSARDQIEILRGQL